MSEEQTKLKCGACRFYFPPELTYGAGTCRRHAPIADPNSDFINRIWPKVFEFEVCGDFEPADLIRGEE